MSKTTLKELAAKFTFHEETAKNFLHSIKEHIHSMDEGDKIYIKGLGTFEVKKVPTRQVRNPTTGETFQKEEHLRLKFSLSTALKNSVK